MENQRLGAWYRVSRRENPFSFGAWMARNENVIPALLLFSLFLRVLLISLSSLIRHRLYILLTELFFDPFVYPLICFSQISSLLNAILSLYILFLASSFSFSFTFTFKIFLSVPLHSSQLFFHAILTVLFLTFLDSMSSFFILFLVSLCFTFLRRRGKLVWNVRLLFPQYTTCNRLKIYFFKLFRSVFMHSIYVCK